MGHDDRKHYFFIEPQYKIIDGNIILGDLLCQKLPDVMGVLQVSGLEGSFNILDILELNTVDDFVHEVDVLVVTSMKT